MIEASILLLVLPIAYVALKWGNASAEIVFIISFIVEFITQIVRVFLVMPKINMRIKDYFKKIYLPILFVCIPVGIYALGYQPHNTIISFVGTSILAEIIICLSVWTIGIRHHERIVIKEKAVGFINKRFHTK